MGRLDGIDFRQTAPLTSGEPLLRPQGLEWRKCEEVLTKPLGHIKPVMVARAGGLDQGNIILNLVDVAANLPKGQALYLAGSAINSIQDSSGHADAKLGAQAMREALEMWRQGAVSADASDPAGHARALYDVAKRGTSWRSPLPSNSDTHCVSPQQELFPWTIVPTFRITRPKFRRYWGTLPWDAISQSVEALWGCCQRGGRIFTMGNGGHANTASHMINDLAKHTTTSDDKKAVVAEDLRFRTTCLNDSVSFVTGIGNDMGYDYIFSEQVANWVQPGDVVIGVSGSGNSKNIL